MKLSGKNTSVVFHMKTDRGVQVYAVVRNNVITPTRLLLMALVKGRSIHGLRLEPQRGYGR